MSKFLGVLCRYSISDIVTVRADALDEKLRAAGGEKAVPSRRGPADALRRALSDLATQYPHVEYSPHEGGWGVYGHFERTTAEAGRRRVRKGLLKVVLDEGRLRRIWSASDAHYHPVAEELWRWLVAKYSWYHNYHDGDKVRTCVTNLMALLGFPHVYPGVFFVPLAQRDAIEDLRTAFSARVMDRGEVWFSETELADTPTNRKSLRGDFLHNIEDFLERVRTTVLCWDLEEGDTPHPETLRDWIKRLADIGRTLAYLSKHALGDELTAPPDLEELGERITQIRAAKLGEATHREDTAA